MDGKKEVKVVIPEGCFEGNCYSCFYAKKKDMDEEGRMLCQREPGRRYFPYEKDGCKYYASRIIERIKISVMAYIAIAILVAIIEWFLH